MPGTITFGGCFDTESQYISSLDWPGSHLTDQAVIELSHMTACLLHPEMKGLTLALTDAQESRFSGTAIARD